jgi:hypothetical protein
VSLNISRETFCRSAAGYIFSYQNISGIPSFPFSY